MDRHYQELHRQYVRKREIEGPPILERVRKGFEVCLSGGLPQRCPECPYHNAGCSMELQMDADDLLDEQEQRIKKLEDKIALMILDFYAVETTDEPADPEARFIPLCELSGYRGQRVYVTDGDIEGWSNCFGIVQECGFRFLRFDLGDYGLDRDLDSGRSGGACHYGEVYQCWTARPTQMAVENVVAAAIQGEAKQ